MARKPPLSSLHARYAALTRDRDPDDPVRVQAQRDFAAAKINDYVQQVLADAPPLSDEQRTALAELLRPVRRRGTVAPEPVSRD